MYAIQRLILSSPPRQILRPTSEHTFSILVAPVWILLVVPEDTGCFTEVLCHFIFFFRHGSIIGNCLQIRVCKDSGLWCRSETGNAPSPSRHEATRRQRHLSAHSQAQVHGNRPDHNLKDLSPFAWRNGELKEVGLQDVDGSSWWEKLHLGLRSRGSSICVPRPSVHCFHLTPTSAVWNGNKCVAVCCLLSVGAGIAVSTSHHSASVAADRKKSRAKSLYFH
jgi:hypothetical protein